MEKLASVKKIQHRVSNIDVGPSFTMGQTYILVDGEVKVSIWDVINESSKYGSWLNSHSQFARTLQVS